DATRPKPGENDLRGFEWHYWDRQCHAELAVAYLDLGRDSQPARPGSHAISGDGSRFAAAIPREPGGTTGAVKVWNTAGGQQVRVFPIEQPAVVTVALNGDGSRLAVALVPETAAGKEPLAGLIAVWDI